MTADLVLHIEPDALFSRLLAEVLSLRQTTLRFTTVADLEAALPVIEAEEPAAVLVDPALPDSKPTATLDWIRSHTQAPIIVLGRMDRDMTAEDAYAMGAGAFLSKRTATAGDIASHLTSLIGTRNATPPAATPTSATPEANRATPRDLLFASDRRKLPGRVPVPGDGSVRTKARASGAARPIRARLLDFGSGGARVELRPFLRNYPIGSDLDLTVEYEGETLRARATVRQVDHYFVTDQLGVELDPTSVGPEEIIRFTRYCWRRSLTAQPVPTQ